MALTGCPDSFLYHPYYQDKVEQTPHSQQDLAGPGLPAQPDQLVNHQEDDVDLEALVNDMNASLESMQLDTVPLLQNGQHACSQPRASGTQSVQPQASPRQRVQHSQAVYILAVRCLQEEEQQFRTSSRLAIPNCFPKLCGPGSPTVLTRASLPLSQAAA
ncbi:Growth factor receptor-bound protein 10 [Saguinus oedipus]|uniref:Growth factor receptor-bound protein 10 n=1 Tax=Saguinus oedipus TaxID=9490 RepID=A0ABQ9WDL4_SAGOE|nr:Growth factor receptor-bound protein 10 [Saguinus oedipus]